MLQLARQRMENELPDLRDQVRFLHQDIMNWAPPGNAYDLVVTHFVLDCFPLAELAQVVKNLATATKPDADWLLADFRLPDRGFARLQARVWLAAMYQFFRFTARIKATELIDAAPYLQAKEFSLACQHFSRTEMLKSELWRNIGILPVRPADMMSAVSDSAE
jgi:ubiquinone/menaquinone biosynthesis C-methylase UbiE